MITRCIVATLVVLFLISTAVVRAGEHPGQPMDGTKLPETRTGNPVTQVREVTTVDISTGIKRHVASDKKKFVDRKFHTKYNGKDVAMDLVKVHDDRVSTMGGGKYFACVDMKGADGTAYDIDFFLIGNPGDLRVTEAAVHKINGKPLYNWKEQGGVLVKVKS